MIESKQVRIDIISPNLKGQVVSPPRTNFVKITHIESDICVTKEGKTQLKARDEAFEELNMLIELWEG